MQHGAWYVAYRADVPGANGQGKTREECLANLREATASILEYRREESLRALPRDARQELVVGGWSAIDFSGAFAVTVACCGERARFGLKTNAGQPRRAPSDGHPRLDPRDELSYASSASSRARWIHRGAASQPAAPGVNLAPFLGCDTL